MIVGSCCSSTACGFTPTWTPWLEELDEADYDAVVLSWGGGDRSADDGLPRVKPGFDALLGAARRHVEAFRSRPIVIGHGVGGAVAERLLNDGDATVAISLAPVPGGYTAVPTAAHLLRHASRLALLSLHGSADARDFYEKYVVADKPRPVLLHAVRHRTRASSRQVQRGPLLLAAGGKDELVRETSIAPLHSDYRRRQPDAVTDYKVFPGMDHTLGLGTQGVAVLFYCLDWLTAQNM